MHSAGYIMVYAPGHPACNCRNYAPLHIKTYFDFHGELPGDGWDVHHWDADKGNNEISNLEPKTGSDHGKENGKGGAHRRRFLRGMRQAKEAGAKGGRKAARNRRHTKKQTVRRRREK